MALSDWLLTLRNKAAGLVPYGGTISRTTETDEYPVFIANEGMGGAHSYNTLGQLAEVNPSNLVKGMLVTVNQHTSPGGSTRKATTYRLETVPSQKISTLAGYDEETSNYIEDYYKVFAAVGEYEGTLETEYAPSVAGARPSFDIGSPWYQSGFKLGRKFEPTAVDATNDEITLSAHPFVDSGVIKFDTTDTLPSPLSSATTYYAKKISADVLEIYTDSNLTTIVNLTDAGLGTHYIFEPSDIWTATYDATGASTYNGEPTSWMRQRVGSSTNWGMPVKVFGNGYEQGDYVDTRFRWELASDPAPDTPPQTFNGVLNNEPQGWFDVPDVPAGVTYTEYRDGTGPAPADVAHKLYKTTATKDAYGQLKTPWTAPYEISTDDNLVQYGNLPSTNPTDNPDDWRPYYSPLTDTHMASRTATNEPWIITKITNEEGQYTEFIFKAYNISYSITESDRPQGEDPTGWSDAPVALAQNQILYVSSSTKYNDGSLKSPWSLPQRFDGRDTIQAVIETNSSHAFKKSIDATGTLVTTPASITLNAKLYKGGAEITTGLSYQWYLTDNTPGNELGIQSTEIITPDDVTNQQLFLLEITHEGIVYSDTITILDVTDGANFAVSIDCPTGFTYKSNAGAETKTFTANFYKDGVLDNTGVTWLWELENYAVPDIANGTNQTYQVADTDVDDYAELKITATFGSYSATWTERLTDVNDGAGVDVQYHLTDDADPGTGGIQAPDWDDVGWGDTATGAYWMRVKLTTESWSASSEAIRIRGESGDPAGATVIFAFKNSIDTPLTPDNYGANLIPSGASPNDNWADAPTAISPASGTFTVNTSTDVFTSAGHGLESGEYVTVSSSNSDLPVPLQPYNYYYFQKIDANTFKLAEVGDISNPINITDVGSGTLTWQGVIKSSTWQVSRTFKLKAGATAYDLNDTNWTHVDAWSDPIKISGKDGTAIGVPGAPGPHGWSPVFAIALDGGRRVLKLADWVGGGDAGTKPAVGTQYVGSAGFVTSISEAVDVGGGVTVHVGSSPPPVSSTSPGDIYIQT